LSPAFAAVRPEPAAVRPSRSRLTGRSALTALWLVACAPSPAADIAGLYRHEGPIAATLEVRADAGQYVVRLEGGGAAAAGAASAADCVVEARGELDGAVLRAPFGPVETDTFSYGAAAAEREGRVVEIVFEPGAAAVIEAGTSGYCGWGADLSGRYRALG
jgi:hypothetical protein